MEKLTAPTEGDAATASAARMITTRMSMMNTMKTKDEVAPSRVACVTAEMAIATLRTTLLAEDLAMVTLTLTTIIRHVQVREETTLAGRTLVPPTGNLRPHLSSLLQSAHIEVRLWTPTMRLCPPAVCIAIVDSLYHVRGLLLPRCPMGNLQTALRRAKIHGPVTRSHH